MTKRMGTVICDITISADGYSAGLNQTEERPFGDDGGGGVGRQATRLDVRNFAQPQPGHGYQTDQRLVGGRSRRGGQGPGGLKQRGDVGAGVQTGVQIRLDSGPPGGQHVGWWNLCCGVDDGQVAGEAADDSQPFTPPRRMCLLRQCRPRHGRLDGDVGCHASATPSRGAPRVGSCAARRGGVGTAGRRARPGRRGRSVATPRYANRTSTARPHPPSGRQRGDEHRRMAPKQRQARRPRHLLLVALHQELHRDGDLCGGYGRGLRSAVQTGWHPDHSRGEPSSRPAHGWSI
jgi:hypothetical protein